MPSADQNNRGKKTVNFKTLGWALAEALVLKRIDGNAEPCAERNRETTAKFVPASYRVLAENKLLRGEKSSVAVENLLRSQT
jgi:hypothetical protein